MSTNEVEVIISRVDWKGLQEGSVHELTIFRESQLHYFFGDYPEQYVVRARVVFDGQHQTCEDQLKLNI
jgi:hypothetical protein